MGSVHGVNVEYVLLSSCSWLPAVLQLSILLLPTVRRVLQTVPPSVRAPVRGAAGGAGDLQGENCRFAARLAVFSYWLLVN